MKREEGRDLHGAGDQLHAGITAIHDHNRQLKLRTLHVQKCPCLKASEEMSESDTKVTIVHEQIK